jgi:2-aminoadipate transaminase
MLPGWKRALQSVGVIDLAIGQPARSLLPIDKLARASAHRFSKFGGWDAQEMLQYSGARGTAEFSAALAKFLSHNYGMPVHAEELMVVNGSSGGLELVCSVFARAGETVLVEEASYFLAFNIFRSHGLNVIPVRSKEGGLCVHALREVVEDPQADAYVRLCYAFYEVDELVEAAKRLGLAISELTRRMRAL